MNVTKPRFSVHAVHLACSLFFLAMVTPSAFAGGGPLGIDSRLGYDNSGIWARKYQLGLQYGLLLAEVSGAVWEGGDSRLGRTLWKSIDASVVSGVASEALKVGFSRVRPIDSGGNPDLWFKGKGNQSFPSGEVALASAVVTPVILEYVHDQPWIVALELLPLYDGIARMKVQAHWQSDVIAGWAIGTAAGWWMQRNPETPFVLRAMPHGVYVGLSRKF